MDYNNIALNVGCWSAVVLIELYVFQFIFTTREFEAEAYSNMSLRSKILYNLWLVIFTNTPGSIMAYYLNGVEISYIIYSYFIMFVCLSVINILNKSSITAT